jgi:hypothetical protein
MEMAAALRMLADDIEHDRVPAPFDVKSDVWWLTGDDGHLGERVTPVDARLSMDLTPGGWSKSMSDAYVSYVKNYGGNVQLDINIERAQVCRKVEVGTRTVPATEAHEVPVYEWECDPE